MSIARFAAKLWAALAVTVALSGPAQAQTQNAASPSRTAVTEPAPAAAVMLTARPALSAKPATVEHDRAPPDGVGALILGYAGIGLGALNLALLPVCSAGFYPGDTTEFCVGFYIAYGAISIGAGIPLAIMGHVRRNRYLRWREHRAEASCSPRFGVLPDPRRPQLTASFRF